MCFKGFQHSTLSLALVLVTAIVGTGQGIAYAATPAISVDYVSGSLQV
jgi:hypothetical protein